MGGSAVLPRSLGRWLRTRRAPCRHPGRHGGCPACPPIPSTRRSSRPPPPPSGTGPTGNGLRSARPAVASAGFGQAGGNHFSSAQRDVGDVGIKARLIGGQCQKVRLLRARVHQLDGASARLPLLRNPGARATLAVPACHESARHTSRASKGVWPPGPWLAGTFSGTTSRTLS